jgi:hypothetical protein
MVQRSARVGVRADTAHGRKTVSERERMSESRSRQQRQQRYRLECSSALQHLDSDAPMLQRQDDCDRSAVSSLRPAANAVAGDLRQQCLPPGQPSRHAFAERQGEETELCAVLCICACTHQLIVGGLECIGNLLNNFTLCSSLGVAGWVSFAPQESLDAVHASYE